MKRVLVVLVALSLVLFASNAFALSITNMTTAANLATALTGSGVSISNVTYAGDTLASGTFTGGVAGGLGIESGVVLTSSHVTPFLNHSNNSTGSYTINNSAGSGNVHLNGVATGSVNDASMLGFDFVSNGDAAYFNYVFGSEEYNEWVGSQYNDVFGFFVAGVTTPSPFVNVALIPGTSTPVAINNVNNGSYSAYYNDNTGGAFANELDGFTTVLQAQVTGLTAGETYHIDMAVCDVGDSAYDAAVFIQAGSFSDKPTDPSIPEPGTMLLLGSGLLGLVGYRKKS